jgi:hypothetical protein
VAFCRHGNEPPGFMKAENALPDRKTITTFTEGSLLWNRLAGWMDRWLTGWRVD